MRMGSKTYLGMPTPHGIQARIRQGTSEEILALRLTLVKRSPEEWMDPNTGPNQLALAILADATGNEQYALTWCAEFTKDITSWLPAGEGWYLTFHDVLEWIHSHKIP